MNYTPYTSTWMSLYIQANAFSQNILPFPIGHQNWVKFEKKIMKTCKCTEKRNDRS